MDERLAKMLHQIENEYAASAIQPAFEVMAPRVEMLPMSDGVMLYTVICTPVGVGPFPTIVVRSCYPDQEPLYRTHAREYCRRGFAYVYQFCRGTGKSEGQWVPNIHDRQDGKETLDWLSAQSFVESIGYWGCSYLAFTGWILADIVPEKVKTMYLTHYGADRFASAYQNGLFRQDILSAWAMGNAGYPIHADYMESLKFRPQVEVDERLWGKRIDWYRDWVTNTNRDDPYWNSGFWKQLRDIPSKVKVPVYIGEGWYDHHLGSALRTFESLSEESKKHSVLRIGAWNHGFMPCVEGTAQDHLENSDTLTALDWFYKILCKKQLPKGKVCIYQIGADRWQEKAHFPFPAEETRSFHLTAKKIEDGVYELSDKAENEPSSVSYRYDPDNPVMSHGAESCFASFEVVGSKLQPECGWREDVVSFLSAPVETDLDILGKIQLRLSVASDAEDTAFTAKLMEVWPNGKAYNIRSGITTLAYRKGADLPRIAYTPGKPVEAVIEMWDVSWKLHKGSRLRVDISSSDFPQYAVHTNHAGVWAKQVKAKIANQTIFTGPAALSRVILPVQYSSDQ